MKIFNRVGILKLGRPTWFDSQQWGILGADIETVWMTELLTELSEQVTFWGEATLDSYVPARNLQFKPFELEQVNDQVLVVINGPQRQKGNHLIKQFRQNLLPAINFINQTNMPWVYLYSDPRFKLRVDELQRFPDQIWAQAPLMSQNITLGAKSQKFDYLPLDLYTISRLGRRKKQYPLDNRHSILRLVGNGKTHYWQTWEQLFMPGLDRAGIDWEIWGDWPEAPKNETRCKKVSLQQQWETITQTKHALIMVNPEPTYDTGYPLTGRYLELAASDTLVWINQPYDHLAQLIPTDSFIRVKDGIELAQKIEQVNKDPKLYYRLINEQRSRFRPRHKHPAYLTEVVRRLLHQLLTRSIKLI